MTRDDLDEPEPYLCECGHDLAQHTQGYWAPCNADDCDCKDFVHDDINDDGLGG